MAPKNAPKRLQSLSPSSTDPTGRQKRTVTVLACNRCRLKKVKCDGLRPACATCNKHSQICRYDSELPRPTRQNNEELRNEGLNSQQQIARLHAQPDAGSSIVKNTLATRMIDVQASWLPLVPGITMPSPDARPSPHKAARATLPYTETSLEYELFCKHPDAYHIIEPYEHPDVVANTLLGFGSSPFRYGIEDSATHGPLKGVKLCDE